MNQLSDSAVRWLLVWASVALLLFLLAYLLHQAVDVFADLAAALLIALLLRPAVCWQQRRLGLPAWFAIANTIALAGLLGFLLLLLISLQLRYLAMHMQELLGRMPQLVASWQLHLSDIFGISPEQQQEYWSWFVGTRREELILYAQRLATGSGRWLAKVLISLSILPVYIFCLLYFRQRIRWFLLVSTPKAYRCRVDNMLRKLQDVLFSYLSGMLLVFVFVSLLDTLILLAFDVRHALLFGILAGLLNFIPYIGTLIGGLLPMAFALLTKESLWYPLGIGLAFWAVQLIENNLIVPRIIGDRVNLNAFTVILALIFGGMFWGAIGLVLVIPYTAMLKIILEEIPSTQKLAILMSDASLPASDKNTIVDSDPNSEQSAGPGYTSP